MGLAMAKYYEITNEEALEIGPMESFVEYASMDKH